MLLIKKSYADYNGWTITVTSVLVFFCFFYTISPDCFKVGLTGTSWLYIILCIGFFVAEKKGILRKPQYFGGCLLYLFVIVILQLIHGEYTSAFWNIISFLVISCIFVTKVDNKNVFLKLVDAVIYSGMVVCLFGFVEALTDFNVFYSIFNTVGAVANYNPERLGMVRIIGFTSHAISYAAYLMFLLYLTMYRMSQEIKRKRKRRYMFIYIIAAINAVLTLSRSALMAILLCQLLLLLKLGVRKAVKRIILVICSALVLSLVIQILVPDFDFISQFFLMMLGVFNKSASSVIADAVGANANGIGERILLYRWVWDSVKGNVLIGLGGESAFSYDYTIASNVWHIIHTKQSIEVQYLYQLYHYGLVGMLAQIAMYVSLLIAGMRSIKKSKTSWEGKLTFDFVFLITMAACFLLFFAVNQATERYIFRMFIYLFFAYSTNKIYTEHDILVQ